MEKEVADELHELGIVVGAIELALMVAMLSVFREIPEAAVFMEEKYPLLLDSLSGNAANIAAVRERTERILRAWLK
jgi:hypothetical protein